MINKFSTMPTTASSKGPLPNVPKQSFLSRNLVAIVIIPSIIGIHYGWSLMQDNRTLVSESEKIDLPVVKFAKFCWNRVLGKEAETVGAVQAATAAK